MNLATHPCLDVNTSSAPPVRDARVLVVDDEPALCSLLSEYFGRHKLQVRHAYDAAVARTLIAQVTPDVVVLDINMPGENGLSLARWIKAEFPDVGILMLTTVNDSVDRVLGLEMGADDYVSKPFDLRELLARVRALSRRAMPRHVAVEAETQRLRFGRCWLDRVERKLLSDDGQEVEITPSEYELLALFAKNPNRALSREQIMEQTHNRGWEVFDRSIDLRVMRLRRKVEVNPDTPVVIKTIRSVGYMFVPTA